MFDPDCKIIERDRRYQMFIEEEMCDYSNEYASFVSGLMKPFSPLQDMVLFADSMASSFLSDNCFDEFFKRYNLNYLHVYAWLGNLDDFSKEHEKMFPFEIEIN